MIGGARRPLVAVGVIVALMTVGLRGAVTLAGWWRDARAVLRTKAEAVARLRQDVGSLGALEDSARGVHARMFDLAPRILEGRTDAQALADLTSRLQLLADQERVRLERADPRPDSAAIGELRRVAVHVAFEGDSPGILGTLRELETGPLIFTIRSPSISAPDPLSAESVPEILRVELDLSAWYLAAAPVASASP